MRTTAFYALLVGGLFLAACNQGARPTNNDDGGNDDNTEENGSASNEDRNNEDRDRGPERQTERGTLESGDQSLRSGEFADEHKVRLEAGQTIDVRMTSSDLDPYLILRFPNGAGQEDNDDYDASSGTEARIRYEATESGLYSILATTFQPGESGDYTVTYEISEGDSGGSDDADDTGDGNPGSGKPVPDGGDSDSEGGGGK